MDKAELRKLFLEKRGLLTEQEFAEINHRLAANLTSLPYSSMKFVHIFYPIQGKREFNTLLLKDWISVNHPEIKLVLPKSDFKNHTLEHQEWSAETHLQVNKWGITEPVGGRRIEPRQLDMILIPLLAFDKLGNRIGYGKGFYDRFLKDCKPTALKVGVSFFNPTEHPIDTNEFDVPLDMCVTPERTWNFRPLHSIGSFLNRPEF